MVLHETARFHFRLCECGAFKRGEDYKKHVRKQLEDKDEHVVRKFLIGCVSCLAFKFHSIDAADFYKKHRECKSGSVTNQAFKTRFIKFNPNVIESDSEEEAERELELAIANINSTPIPQLPPPPPPPPAAEVPAVISPIRGDEILPELTDSEEEEEEEEETAPRPTAPTPTAPTPTAPIPTAPIPTAPLCSSSPTEMESRPQTSAPSRGIHLQTKRGNDDDEGARTLERAAYRKMQNTVATLTKHNKELVGENRELKEKANRVTALQQQVTTLSHYEKRAKASEARVAELEESLRKLRKDNDRLAVEKTKVEADLAQMKLKSLSQRRTTLHLPMADNKVVDAVLKEDDNANTTFSCYEGSHSQVECVHLTFVHEGDFAFVRHRKKKRAMPSKCFKTE